MPGPPPEPSEPSSTIVRPYTALSPAEWDQFVAINPEAGYGHTTANFRLAEVRGIRNESFAVCDLEGKPLVLMPLFVTESHELRHLKMRNLVSGLFPAGPLYASGCPPKQRKALLAEIARHLLATAGKVGVDEIRVLWPNVIAGEPALERFGYLPLREFGFAETNLVGFLLDLQRPEEELRKGFNENCRRNIQRAEKSGVEIRPVLDRAEWLACDDINRSTLGPFAHSRRELEIIWDEFILKRLATALAAVHNGNIVTVIVTVDSPLSSYYWIGWNRLAKEAPGASHRTMWEAILLSARSGRKFFELGTKEFTNPKMLTISQFKESFGGKPMYCVGGVQVCRPVKRAALDLAAMAIGGVRKRPR